MDRSAEKAATPLETTPNYRAILPEYTGERYPDVEISEAGYAIAGDLLNFVRKTYSNPDSPLFLGYHNDRHSFSVTKRELWILSFIKKTLHRNIEPIDFELGVIASAGHDAVQAKFRDGKEMLEFTFEDYAIHLDNDPEKSDEQLSAELVVAMMRHHGKHDINEQRRAYTSVRATEYIRIGKDISLSDIAKNARDPVVISTVMADTSSIFAGGEEAMMQDVSDLSAEILGDDINDPARIAEVVTGMMDFQKKFIMARAAEYNMLLRHLGVDSNTNNMFEALTHKFEPLYQHNIAAADYVHENIAVFREHLAEEFANIRDKSLTPYKKLGLAVTKAYAALSTGE